MLEAIVATSQFDDVSTALTTNVTGSTILEPIATLLPWIGAMVGVAFGIYVIKKLIKRISKGKAGM